MKICKIEDCNNKHHAKGYCRMHYTRMWKYGDPFYTKIEMHGMVKTPEYSTWYNMKSRCYNKIHNSYLYYGGRGITVCDRWKNSFMAFYKDMGPRPLPRAEINRIDNNQGYFPENCRWTTHVQNGQNQSITKLNMQKAKEIRELYKAGGITRKELSLIYGVSPGPIGHIISNRCWRQE